MTPEERSALVAALPSRERFALIGELLASVAAGSGTDLQAVEAPREVVSGTPRYLDSAGAAAFLHVGENQLGDLARSGEIPFRRSGRRRLFDREDLVAWAEREKVRGPRSLERLRA
ncbi:SinI-like, DNA-binding domain [uncultured Caudovirales phage]|uniref:SinI-like, DNA-binding domain n=1 Tax=uncultured Caudovirales phage TaxID=2100421 RepID=A0A6J5S745_9CAUD|nr:SinI-like, DNA-binding domain [uncultured Caudovirales phage]CAB4173138.1 SinI-like, DNA-binding domain [uncultured Caudovirales phage]CAB4179627.1 SinI-like, DNA-binding domain [uncultured Caudovirales phage]CAB4204330.1 SinI-like, DNA-binding domain [uncultured Caudovirales phage]CAB4216064.1 SinI-like, DNA-binding domain [uncultured Caudovirales phage]